MKILILGAGKMGSFFADVLSLSMRWVSTTPTRNG